MSIRELAERLKDTVAENRKVVLPIVLVVAILITMGIGISANRKKQQQEEVQTNAQPGQEETAKVQEGLAVPETGLEENAYPEINELIMKYYKAMEENDTDALTEIISPLTEAVLIRFTEWAKHTEACPAVNIYTKPGPREDSYIAYVVADIQIVGYEGTVPGMASFFICKMQSGSEAAQTFLKVEESITKGIQEALLVGQEAEQAEEAVAEEGTEQEETPQTAAGKKAKALDVVNMRSSDSEKADKLGKAEIGDVFDVLEERANGWTKLSNGTQEFYIKSQYLEIISEESAEASQSEETQTPEQQEAPAAVDTSLGSNGYVTAKTTVNVRKSASENGERLGTIYMGERLELVMNQADGWCKVKYQGQTAYVKSEFME